MNRRCPKKTSRWPTDTWKDAQYHLVSGKCKSKPQWDVTSHQSEWLKQKHKKQQVLVRVWSKRDPRALLMGIHTGAATLENSMEVPQKVKNRATLWPSNCTIRYLPKECKNTDSKRHMHPDVFSSFIYSSQTTEMCPSVHQLMNG